VIDRIDRTGAPAWIPQHRSTHHAKRKVAPIAAPAFVFYLLMTVVGAVVL